MNATATKQKVKKVKKQEGDPYLFEELSKEAQQKVISDNYDINVDYEWWDGTYDDAAQVGIKLEYFDLGRSRSISGELMDSAKEVAEKILEQHGEGCDTYKTAQSFLNDLLPLMVKSRLLEGVTDDDGDDICIEVENEIEELSEQFQKDILNDYWKILDDDHDYLTSEEAIIETIKSNEYEFEEDGSRF